MKRSDVPRWLRLQEEIDYLYFTLGQIHRQGPKSPIEQMIDDASGFAAARKAEVREIVSHMKELKAEWSKETGEEASTQMEDEILAALGTA